VRGGRGFGLASAVVLIGAPLAGCGGQRQDAHEPSGSYTVNILRASFPTRQNLSHAAHLVLVVRNDGNKTVPNLAVSINSFSEPSQEPGLANPNRPVWIVDTGPGATPSHPIESSGPESPNGAATAYVNTWAMGAVRPHQVRTLSWKVTAISPGVHRLTYTVAAGLNGKARAELANGQAPRGSFTVAISSAAAQVHVDPNTGQVLQGPPPLGP
jgi:hypothetical protein